MTKARDLKIRFKALDRISKTIDRVKNKFPKLARSVNKASKVFKLFTAQTKRFRDSMKKAGRAMSTAGKTMTTNLSLPIALAGGAILRTGVEFQRSMNKVGAITRTIVGKEVTPAFKALEKQALELGGATEFSSKQAADAMSLLGRAGFTANEILASTDDVLALASASGMELAFTADVMAKTIRAFGLDAKDATRVSDVLADVSRRTNVDLETISETFKQAAPIAKTYGASLEQTAAITGLLGDVGIQGSMAGTALKNIFLKLATPTAKATKMLKAMGIAVSNTDGSMKSAGSIISEIGPKLGKLNKANQLAVLNELFGLRGIAGASAIMAKRMKEGKNPVAALTETLKGSTGAAKEMQKIMQRGAVGALSRFQSALSKAGLAFASSGVLDMFTSILIKAEKFFTSLSELNPVVLKTIVIFAGFVAAIGPIIIFMGSMVTAIGNLTIAWAALKGAAIVIGGILSGLSLPFVAIGVAIVALVAGVTRLITKWSELKKAFSSGKGVFDTIKKVGKVFFGFGSGDAKKEDNQKTKSAVGFGQKLGAQRAVNQVSTSQSIEKTNNASVKVQFENAPKGTKVRSKSDGPISLDLGFAGGIQ